MVDQENHELEISELNEKLKNVEGRITMSNSRISIIISPDCQIISKSQIFSYKDRLSLLQIVFCIIISFLFVFRLYNLIYVLS